MFDNKIKSIIGLMIIIMLLAGNLALAKTWHLKQDQQWKSVSQADGKYMLAVAEIKKLIGQGQCKNVAKAFATLKEDFPQTVGPDLDLFIKAELFYCKGKFTKAGRTYKKFLAEYPESPLYEVVLDRQFTLATAFLGGQKRRVLKIFKIKGYAEGENIMENITDLAGEAPIGKKAAIALAKNFEKRRKFNDAYYKWSEISSRWPTGQLGQDALLAKGRCQHAAYKGSKYDASNLISAKTYYEEFNSKYPDAAKRFEIGKRTEEITEQLAYKQFGVGMYYDKTDNKQAANFYYQMVISQWPNSVAAKMSKVAMEDNASDSKKGESWQKRTLKKLEKLLL